MAENSSGTARGPGRPFKKGESGNPGGRPRGTSDLRELARTYAPEAIDRLVRLMREGENTVAIRAAEALLDRGWGRPIQDITPIIMAEMETALERLEKALSPEECARALKALAGDS